MAPRLELQKILEEINGNRNVYFQPVSNIQMNYPAIVYSLDDIDTEFASNRPYKHANRYMVTVIDRNPETSTPDKIKMLPMSFFSRYFASENLNHYVFNLYF